MIIKGVNIIEKEVENVEKPSLFGMVTNPIEQFKRIKDAPFFGKTLLIIMAITIVGLWITSLGVKLPPLDGLSEEEIAAGRTFANIGIVIIGIFTTVFSILVSTIVYFLFTKVVQAKVTFKQLFSMNTYIMLITAISMVVNGIFIALIGNYGENDPLYTSLAKYINADGKLGVIFNGIEVFAVWTLILTAIGLHYVAGISKRLAWAIAGLFFVTSIISGIMGLQV